MGAERFLMRYHFHQTGLGLRVAPEAEKGDSFTPLAQFLTSNALNGETMSFAFLPLYTGDYLRDTRHLTPMRHGIYVLLLMHCWDQKGPLPLDEQECAGIANCRSADEIEALRYIVNKFFIRMDDGHYNARMQAEVERSEVISDARSKAGKKGYQAKAKQLLSKSQASATTPTPTPKPSPPPAPPSPPSLDPGGTGVIPAVARTKVPAASRGHRLPSDWLLPKKWGDWALEEFPTWTPEAVRHAAATFRDHWVPKTGRDATKTDWEATWRNWCRKERIPPALLKAPDKSAAKAEELAEMRRLLNFSPVIEND